MVQQKPVEIVAPMVRFGVKVAGDRTVWIQADRHGLVELISGPLYPGKAERLAAIEALCDEELVEWRTDGEDSVLVAVGDLANALGPVRWELEGLAGSLR